MSRHLVLFVVLMGFVTLISPFESLAEEDILASGFSNPPAEAKARTWWHWVNGHVSREGIIADLEAMHRLGIQEAQLFNVDMGIPNGTLKYLSPEWLDMLAFAVSEAKRLGMEIGLNNSAGWSSTGGPWITPEYAMQQIVYSDTLCVGGKTFRGKLPQPTVRHDYYRDIAVFAFPKPEQEIKLDELALKSLSGHSFRNHLLPDDKPIVSDACIRLTDIIDLTSSLQPDGTLAWEAPEGEWVILRLGHTPTGAMNAPAPVEGRGLECDKMNKAAIDAYWNGGIQPILDKLGKEVGTTFKNCIIDSYEVGCNNWTIGFENEFERLRGYDCWSYLPALAGYYLESGEITERFLWDFRRTVGDLISENYYHYFAERCHKVGLQFSVEPYGGPFECLQVGRAGDIVMSEFWSGKDIFFDSPKFVSSIAHVNGKKIVGAESFTNLGGWQEHPATLKSIGDRAWIEGINRIIFHTYVHQPIDSAPGMTLGIHGMEANRLNTWWNQGKSYTDYLARSQYLLQQGRFVADILVFAGESSPNDAWLKPEIKRLGLDYDLIGTPNMKELSVEEGLICTPSGGKYALLLLPNSKWMTPEMLEIIGNLAQNGATIIGKRPEKSPSLENFPDCDRKISRLAAQLWDKQLIKDCSLQSILKEKNLSPDVSMKGKAKDVGFIHRRVNDTDIYFVANSSKRAYVDTCYFRISGKQPELWNPETGEIQNVPVWQSAGNGMTKIPVRLDADGAVFFVFRKPAGRHLIQANVEANPPVPEPLPDMRIVKAEYGTFFPGGLADVTSQVRKQVKEGRIDIVAGNHLSGYDPASGSVKELRVKYKSDSGVYQASVLENEHFKVEAPHLEIEKAVYGKFAKEMDSIPSSYPIYNVADMIEKSIRNGQYRIPVGDYLIKEKDVQMQDMEKELRLVYYSHGETIELSAPQGSDLLLARKSPESVLETQSGEVYWKTPIAGKLNYLVSSGKRAEIQVKRVPEAIPLSGKWEVQFLSLVDTPFYATFGDLVSWPLSEDERIRYFSGTAIYKTAFHLSEGALSDMDVLELNLGSVREIAEVILNGRNLGVLWKKPFRLDVRKVVREGENELEIRVTNLWPNRLIGDKQHPDKKKTFTTWDYWKPDIELLPSGLLGPVFLQPYIRVKIPIPHA